MRAAGSRRSILVRTPWSTFWWYANHPYAHRSLAAVMVAASVAAGIGFGPDLYSRLTDSPGPVATVTATSILGVQSPAPWPEPTVAPTTAPPTTDPPTTAAPPPPVTTVRVTTAPKPTVVAPPKTSAPPANHSSSVSKTVTCNRVVTLTVNGSGAGSITTSISGAGYGSGGSSTTVSGPAGTYTMTVTDAGGSPSLRWVGSGATCS